jgi:serine/threonine-protein kinase PknG
MSTAACSQPGCQGGIVDGYCDECGLARPMSAAAAARIVADQAGAGDPTSGGARSLRMPASSRLGLVPLGTARLSGGTRPTRRLGTAAATARLGAGLTSVPSIPEVDPRQVLMNPPMVAEDKRYCSVCQAPVGRGREGSAGRVKGFCPKCRAPFDFEPKLQAGSLLGGQYEVVGCLAHGGMGWIYLARDRNVNDRWVVLKGLLNAGDPDATRAAVAEKQFLAEVEHPLIVEIYNFVTAADGASYIVMEYVGGRSLNNLLKDRMKATNGRFSPIPVDQAVAYIVEILPAFSYLHHANLLYCDFKPANMIQVGDGLKLIDLGGVRRADDDESPLYGTVGFQAPEVAARGATVASDLYTVARTLAVLIFEFNGYQTTFVDSLPSQDQVPLFAEHDSLYRWLLKGTAQQPEDRFASAEEMRLQLLGVLREISTSRPDSSPSTSHPSLLFETPTIIGASLTWQQLPGVRPDAYDAQAGWLQSVPTDDQRARLEALDEAPEISNGVLLARAQSYLHVGEVARAKAALGETLDRDPWEWRAAWVQGLVALAQDDAHGAIASFNTVYGQLPGELAPKLALARACELAGEVDLAQRLYAVCARTDSAFVAPALFGLSRLSLAAGRRDDALASLAAIPTTSRAYADARRARAQVLAAAADGTSLLPSLGAAIDELAESSASPSERVSIRLDVLTRALAHVRSSGAVPDVRIDGSPATAQALQLRLEATYREAARVEHDSALRTQLVDAANRVRPRTWR